MTIDWEKFLNTAVEFLEAQTKQLKQQTDREEEYLRSPPILPELPKYKRIIKKIDMSKSDSFLLNDNESFLGASGYYIYVSASEPIKEVKT